jgi:adenylylsulfate kinase
VSIPTPAVEQDSCEDQTVPEPKAENIVWHEGHLTHEQRCHALRARGCTLWFTGLSGSGKSTIASALEAELIRRGVFAYRLDGDNVRHGLNANLGFSAADREENIRRVGEVSKLFADAGVIAITSFISPYRADRAKVRALHADAGLPFLEVFVNTPIEVCESRDPKGLYKKARAGEIKGFTGIDDPYEAPEAPEVELKTAEHNVPQLVAQIMRVLDAG